MAVKIIFPLDRIHISLDLTLSFFSDAILLLGFLSDPLPSLCRLSQDSALYFQQVRVVYVKRGKGWLYPAQVSVPN